uniref:Olfactory receptor n=1 Tax=Bombyx mori TaxID=7091 RepID=C4B7Z6_BOMMO|nr:olfactory receptor [Bombyx mori]
MRFGLKGGAAVVTILETLELISQGGFIETIQVTFGGQLSSMLFISACIICSTAVQILAIESPLDNLTTVGWILVYLSLCILILFVDCYFGNTITVKCAYLPTAVFSIPWLDQPKNIQVSTLLFMAKTQQPVQLIAAKLVPVSLTTFTQVSYCPPLDLKCLQGGVIAHLAKD